MSDEKVETGDGQPEGVATTGKTTDGDRDTDTHPPKVEGGQPAVGDDRPRNTEF